MSRIDLYTPWRESSAALQARTIGRDGLIARLHQGGRALLRGAPPLPLYLFGPRGVGKSHVVALVRKHFEQEGIHVQVVPEDIPAITSAEELLDRARPESEVPRWMRVSDVRVAPPSAPPTRPTVLVVEGLDKRLEELGTSAAGREQRQLLRGAWDQSGHTWVIGTGVGLGAALTDREEAFFAWFDPEAILPLTEAECSALMDRLVPEVVRTSPHWAGRRDALVTLSGGSPRVVVTLAETCSAPQAPGEASEVLRTAVDRFTAHDQMRFRDLSGQAQHIVELLATWPKEMGPSEIAQHLGYAATTAGTQARRLAEAGVLARREDRGATWYRVAEPLFRYWLEYRTGSWETTRVAVATSLLQALFSPDEIIHRWWTATDREEDPVLGHALKEPRAEALTRLDEELERALAAHDQRAIERAVRKAHEAGLVARMLTSELLLTVARSTDLQGVVSLLDPEPGVGPTLTFVAALHAGTETPRPLFTRWLGEVHRLLRKRSTQWRELVQTVFEALDQTSGPGTPWVLRDRDAERAAAIPFLRGRLLVRGRLSSHPPALDPAALRGVPLPPDVPDLTMLLNAAVRRSAPDLFERVIVAVDEARRKRPISLPGNAFPGVPCPRRPDLLLGLVLAHLESGGRLSTALSWARTFADCPEATFAAIIERVSASRPGMFAVTEARAGLVALGLANPARLRALTAALPDRWVGFGQESAALASQLGATGPGRLHPELERLRDRLTDPTPR